MVAALVRSEMPVAVTIAGSDSSGGAGIQADIKTFSALGAYGASVITALTAQNSHGVTAVHDVPPDFVGCQIDAVYSDLDVVATKIGMLSRRGVVEVVAARLRHFGARAIVLDPVMISTSGHPLLAPDAAEALTALFLPLVDLVTPNLDEAAALAGESAVAADDAAMARQAEALLRRGAKAVLVKGGHGGGAESVDILLDAGGLTRFAAPRIATRNSHGTGCTLSAAIAAELAKGAELRNAIAVAKTYLSGALAAADRLHIGSGRGPVHHFYGMSTR